jgi:tetratricopeptide (TPR) repeat protein
LRQRLGTALAQQGDVAGAREQFELAVKASPKFARAHYSLGLLSESGGRLKEATDHYLAALASEPSYVEARLRLAAIYRATGRIQEALGQYDRAIEIDPRVSEARFGGAMALVALQRYGEARDRLSQGVDDHPDEPAFVNALARVLAAAPDIKVRDGRRAIAVMQKLSGDQQRLDFGEAMAMALAEAGEYSEAVTWQRAAIGAAAAADRADLAERMGANLKLFEQGKPCRTPWRNGELP